MVEVGGQPGAGGFFFTYYYSISSMPHLLRYSYESFTACNTCNMIDRPREK